MTREDSLTHLKTLHGHDRRDQLGALRFLFAWAKRTGLIFRNPTSRIKVGQNKYGVPQPLAPGQIDRGLLTELAPLTLVFGHLTAPCVAHRGYRGGALGELPESAIVDAVRSARTQQAKIVRFLTAGPTSAACTDQLQ
ncbi:hypothetical protein [Streptomyces sp. NPDC059970]|uniref:hypothetical protein n=1 Tax=Streptomyces sp. NPDC059970 TaxID=3347019 RepID=UPI003681146A